LNENEETRVASLEWLLMLHKKAPSKVRDWDEMRWDDIELKEAIQLGHPFIDPIFCLICYRFLHRTTVPSLRCSKLSPIHPKRSVISPHHLTRCEEVYVSLFPLFYRWFEGICNY
jgi:hypothetical protein